MRTAARCALFILLIQVIILTVFDGGRASAGQLSVVSGPPFLPVNIGIVDCAYKPFFETVNGHNRFILESINKSESFDYIAGGRPSGQDFTFVIEFIFIEWAVLISERQRPSGIWCWPLRCDGGRHIESLTCFDSTLPERVWFCLGAEYMRVDFSDYCRSRSIVHKHEMNILMPTSSYVGESGAITDPLNNDIGSIGGCRYLSGLSLILRGLSLSFGSGGKIAIALDEFIGLDAARFHFGQLALDSVQSPIGHERANYRSSPQDNGENGDPYGSKGRSPGSAILGLFGLALGAALIKLAFDAIDQPQPDWFWRLLSGGLFIPAVYIITHAVALIILGHWRLAL